MSETDERSEIELLLPWYVTGRLDAGDAARVETYLAAHPEMRAQLALVHEEQEEAARSNEALGGPSRAAIESVMAEIARERSLGLSPAGLWDKVSEFLAGPTVMSVRWGAAAAALLILLQAALIGALLTARAPDRYQTASGPSSAQKGFTLLVGFTDRATAPDITALLAEYNAQIIDGPKPGGMYRLRLPAPESEPERQQLVRRLLLRKDVVKIVLLGTE
jgi:hypothetical protein